VSAPLSADTKLRRLYGTLKSVCFIFRCNRCDADVYVVDSWVAAAAGIHAIIT